MNPRKLDEHTWAMFLEVPPARVVLLQAVFEIYEGLGTVRTIGVERPVVCVLTPDGLLDECFLALNSLREQTSWRLLSAEESTQVEADQFLTGVMHD